MCLLEQFQERLAEISFSWIIKDEKVCLPHPSSRSRGQTTNRADLPRASVPAEVVAWCLVSQAKGDLGSYNLSVLEGIIQLINGKAWTNIRMWTIPETRWLGEISRIWSLCGWKGKYPEAPAQLQIFDLENWKTIIHPPPPTPPRIKWRGRGIVGNLSLKLELFESDSRFYCIPGIQSRSLFNFSLPWFLTSKMGITVSTL